MFFALFLVQLTLVGISLCLPSPLFGGARWPDGLLIVLAAAATLASLTLQLPGQNVLLASVLIALMGGAVQTLGALTQIPFGPYSYTEQIGQQLFHPLPWAVPVLWVIVILTSRGVARLMLRPWRKTRAYGFWLLGITVSIVVLFDLALEPFATRVKQYWVWSPTKLPLDWYGAPLVNFFAWAVAALLILAFVTPTLIKKKPTKSPPNYYPLLMWLLLNALFLVGAIAHQLWPAAGLICVSSLTTAILAVRGANW